MRLLFLWFWIPLAAADNFLNTTGVASCALSCIATFTDCPVTDSTCVCYASDVTPKIQDCLLDRCSLEEGMHFEQLLDSSCVLRIEQSQQRLVLNITLSFSGIAILFVLIRIPIQIYENRKIFAEDYSLVFAALGQAALATLYTLAVYKGFGKSPLDHTSSNLRQVFIYMFSATPIYWLVLLLSRMSAVMFFRRMSNSNSKSYLICTNVMMTYIVIWGILIIILSILQCWPLSYNWNMYLDRDSGNNNGYCWNLEVLAYSSNAISLLQDTLVLLLAIPLSWNPKLTTAKRIGAGLIISVFGLFICAASGLRLRSLVSFSHNTFDPIWGNVMEVIWSVIETSTWIIVMSFPVIGNACMNPRFPNDVFGPCDENQTVHLSIWEENRTRERPWGIQSSNSSGDNFVEHKFEIGGSSPFGDRLTTAEIDSIRAKTSLYRMASRWRDDRPHSELTDTTEAREHLSQTFKEYDKIPPKPPLLRPMNRTQGQRLASPIEGVHHDIIWGESLGLPNPILNNPHASTSSSTIVKPLPSPAISELRLYPKPYRMSQTSQNSGISDRSQYSVDSEAYSQLSSAEPRSIFHRSKSPTTMIGHISVASSTQRTESPESLHIRSISQPEEFRPLPIPPVAVRPSTQPSPRNSRMLSQKPLLNRLPSLNSCRVYEETILEHQDENLWADKDHDDWPIPEQQPGKRSRIRRTNSGRAIVFNGQVLQPLN